MKRFFSLLLAMLLVTALLSPAALADRDDVRYGVVRLFSMFENEQLGKSSAGIGTAFAIGKPGDAAQYFITNRHMVEESEYEIIRNEEGEAVGVREIPYDWTGSYIIVDNEENMVPVNLVAVSDRADLALLSVGAPIESRTPLVLRPFDPSEIKTGSEQVYAYGYPGVADEKISAESGAKLPSTVNDITVTAGVIGRISDAASTGKGEQLQIDVAITHGNSGGPLVDSNGYVLGVNTSGSDVDTFNYAVSVNEVIRLLDSERIPYTTDKDVKRAQTMKIALIAAAALLVIIVVLVIVLVSRKKKVSIERMLVVDAGDLIGKSYKLGKTTLIGRDGQRCQIIYPGDAKGVSSVHCTVFIEGDQVKVRDEGSSFGTWINDQKLNPGQSVVMHRGQRLYLGSKKQVLTLR